MRRTGRRRFLLAAGALAAAPLARGRLASGMPVLRLLYPNPTITTDGDLRVIVANIMKSLGWTVGKDLEIQHFSGDGREDRLPALAGRVVEAGVDVIWVAGPEAALAAARATKTIPIAFYGVGYPVEHGLVDSLAKPGRNVTGITSVAGFEWIKNLENLREIAPGVRRLARIRVETVARDIHGREVFIRDSPLDAVAPRIGFEIRKFPVSAPEDLDGAFAAISEWRPEGLMCDFTAMTFRERLRIIDFANRHRLPSLFGALPYVRDGGLMSYGASRRWMGRHSFTFVDRILRGARPADLPVERPTRFELLFNLKTAKALGLTVPQSLLLRADRVFE
jgi:putative tryptophan/tyrosine transport system substrate-binding protein